MNSELDRAITVAFQSLGYPDLRPQQREAVKSFIEGYDSLPTDGGKSLCVAIFPYVLDELLHRISSTVIAVSPLIERSSRFTGCMRLLSFSGFIPSVKRVNCYVCSG